MCIKFILVTLIFFEYMHDHYKV